MVSAKYSDFEGGCKIIPQPIDKILHNPATGEIVMEGPFFHDGGRFRFEGTVNSKILEGQIAVASIKNGKLSPFNFSSSTRNYRRMDYKKFKKQLPGNKL